MDFLQWNPSKGRVPHFIENSLQVSALHRACVLIIFPTTLVAGQPTALAVRVFPADPGDNQPSHQAAGHSLCFFSPAADTESAAGIGGESMGHAIEQPLSESHYTKLNRCFPGQGQLGVLPTGTGERRAQSRACFSVVFCGLLPGPPAAPRCGGAGAVTSQPFCEDRAPHITNTSQGNLRHLSATFGNFFSFYHRSDLSVVTTIRLCLCIVKITPQRTTREHVSPFQANKTMQISVIR